MHIHSVRWGILTLRNYLGQHPNRRGEPLTADPLLWGGLTQLTLQWGLICTLVKFDLLSKMAMLAFTDRMSFILLQQMRYEGKESTLLHFTNLITPKTSCSCTRMKQNCRGETAGSHVFRDPTITLFHRGLGKTNFNAGIACFFFYLTVWP